ncbi:MAG: FAD-binding oxidoreductase, partial [Gammaproteobacteria bacterium]|nr:FAD-binding oxidoreductase [Gammaproteobacteria bacterium]
MNKNHYQNFDHVDSYYAATTNQSLSFRVLQESLRTQVCIIGGGFTGINTAINLAKKGYEVIVIDAAKVGWGASGRNGGQLISGFTFSDKIEKEMGEDIAQSVWELGAKSTDLVRNRIQEFDIQCDLKDGFIEVALNRIQMDEIIHRKAEWEKRGYGHHLTFVDKKDIQSYVKSPNYIAGLIDSGSGHLHPLNLV